MSMISGKSLRHSGKPNNSAAENGGDSAQGSTREWNHVRGSGARWPIYSLKPGLILSNFHCTTNRNDQIVAQPLVMNTGPTELHLLVQQNLPASYGSFLPRFAISKGILICLILDYSWVINKTPKLAVYKL